jgi:hypothetical protein
MTDSAIRIEIPRVFRAMPDAIAASDLCRVVAHAIEVTGEHVFARDDDLADAAGRERLPVELRRGERSDRRSPLVRALDDDCDDLRGHRHISPGAADAARWERHLGRVSTPRLSGPVKDEAARDAGATDSKYRSIKPRPKPEVRRHPVACG